MNVQPMLPKSSSIMILFYSIIIELDLGVACDTGEAVYIPYY